jgi:ribosomal protein L11 methyltransferase
VNGCALSPYGDLHIYYLKGRVAADPHLAGDSFIGNWQEEEDSFLFFHCPAEAEVTSLLQRQAHLSLVDHFVMSHAQWHGGPIEPLAVGRLTILPAWYEPPAPLRSDTLLLDPGVVFGTGTHPTTRDCLEALQSAFAFRPVNSVLDLGTGTGLLAVAAAHMGAGRVVALDLNRLAADTALRNVRLNRMTDRIIVVQGNAKNFIDLACDLMVSNIHFAVMRELVVSPRFQKHTQFIVSGLLRSQAREIELLLQQRAATILRRWSREEIWFTFWGHNAECR